MSKEISRRTLQRALIPALISLFLLSMSCKSRSVQPPVQNPPESATTTPGQVSSSRSAGPASQAPAATEVSPREKKPSTPPEAQPVAPISRLIRIGLATDVRSVHLTAKGWLHIDTLSEEGARSSVAQGEVTVLLEPETPDQQSTASQTTPIVRQNGTLYRVQIASLRDAAAAESLKRELQSRFEVPVSVQFNNATNTHRVRVGEYASRSDADTLMKRLQDAGYVDGWIVKDEISRESISKEPAQESFSLSELNSPTLKVRDERSIELAALPLPDRRAAPRTLVKIFPLDARDYVVYDQVAYRGVLEVVENLRGRLNVINVLDLEDYLKGVVPNEMPPAKFDAIEALKAQAVAARTYALKDHPQFTREGYQLCSTIACQTYRGVDSERPLSSEAVEATRGIVIKYHGELIESLYTSTCGGQTEDAQNIFRTLNVPYLRSTMCPPENSTEIDPKLVEVSGSHLSWNVRLTRADLEKTIRKTVPLDELIDLQPLQHGVSKRVIELRVVGRKRDFTLRGLEIKSALGLKDTLFTLEREYGPQGQIEAFLFAGRGWGHGVGLCQTGAYGLARTGANFESILKTYYFGVDVVKENLREN